VFIFDPDNDVNRPVAGIHDNAIIYWELYPEYLRDLFTKSFTIGLNVPERRITETQWTACFTKLPDDITDCSCGAEFWGKTCWGCGASSETTDNNHLTIVQNPDNPNLFGIRNDSDKTWTYIKPDGTQISVPPGKTAAIAVGVKIKLN
jgi:hypothetical protein